MIKRTVHYTSRSPVQNQFNQELKKKKNTEEHNSCADEEKLQLFWYYLKKIVILSQDKINVSNQQ